MAKLTIKDIARMAGVSTTAVSFVLNDRPGVSEATRQKVQEIIRQTEFIPNVHTRRLNLGKSFTIHVVLKKYAYGLFNQMALETLSGIAQQGKLLGYSIIFTFVDEDMACEQIIESVRGKDCDGVILNHIADPVLIAQLQQENIPFVCVNTQLSGETSLPMVDVDYQDAVYQAAAFLHARGHSRIGFVGPETYVHFAKSYAGLINFMDEAGITAEKSWIWEIPLRPGAADMAVERWLACEEKPTAIVCVGDAFAVDFVCAAKARGLRIPRDVSVMSVGDLLVSRYLDPPLSTMTFDKEQMGAKAMDLLYQLIQGQDYESRTMIRTTPVERESVKTIG